MNHVKAVLVAAVVAMACSVFAADISPTQARRAVDRWLSKPSRLASNLQNNSVSSVESVTNEINQGEVLFHAVHLAKGGIVIASSDDGITPVVAFTSASSLERSRQNPLWDVLQADMRARREWVGRMRKGRSMSNAANAIPRNMSIIETAEKAWKKLTEDGIASANGGSMDIDDLDDVRVEPLVKSQWGQSTVNEVNVYNRFTPKYYVCGCVATAGSQVLRYHEYPTESMPSAKYTCSVDGVSQEKWTKGQNYDWKSMVLVPSDQSWLTDAQCEAIGKLCYDVGVVSEMNWTSGESGSWGVIMANGIKKSFGYASANGYYPKWAASLTETEINNAILANLDVGCPVVLGIKGNDGGHEIVGDGYGYARSVRYVHLNMGWSGSDDTWYNVPSIDCEEQGYTFTFFNDIAYNIFPTKTGDLLTGRVLDASGKAVAGAAVRAKNGSREYTATSNARGIYGFYVDGNVTYEVTASSGSRAGTKSVYVQACVTTTEKAPSDWNSYGTIGNSWGNDITIKEVQPTPSDGILYKIINSQYASVTGYVGTATTLTIPETLGGYPVTTIGGKAFKGNSTLTEVVLPETCESVNTWAFKDCTNLRKLTFRFYDDDEDWNYIWMVDDVFEGCQNLTVSVKCDIQIETYANAYPESGYSGDVMAVTAEFVREGYGCSPSWHSERFGQGWKLDITQENWDRLSGTSCAWSYWTDDAEFESVSAPVLSPTDGQTFTDTLTVTCTCGTDGATIRYTTDGTDPTESSATWPSGGLKLEATTTVKVRGYKTGMTASAVVSATYAKEGDGPGEVGLGVGAVSKFEISGSGTAVICGVSNLTWEAFSAKDGFGNRCYVNEEIVDAEKSAAWVDDNYWCTALNQMDMLVWTGWAADVGYTDVDDLADYFRNSSENLIRRKPARQGETDFPEEGTYGYAGVFDWFADQPEGTELALKTGEVGEGFPRVLSQAIDGGNGLVQCSFMFDCNTRPWLGMKGEITHSVLICGYVCKGTPSASNPTALTGLFLIDSDNDQYTGTGGGSAPNSISYHEVTWDKDSRRYVIHDAWGRDEGWSAFADGDYMWTAEYSVLMAKNVVTTGNDDFADAAELVGDRGTAAGSNVGATRETGEPYHCGSAAAETVWWKWTASEDGTNTVTTEGSAFDTVLAVYTGEDVAHLTLVEDGENDDADADAEQYWSRVSFEAEADTTYYIAVTRGTEDTDGPGAITLNWSASCGDCELEPEGSYTITFDSGEAKSSVTIKDIVADVGAFVTLPECTYEYEGHYFDGWFCEETKETYGDSRKLREVRDLGGDGDTVKLVAQWRSKKKGSSYTVVFKSSNEDDADSESDVYSSGVTYWLNANPFKAPDGLKPAGWICPETGKVYGEREKVVDLADANKIVTLVAQWEGQSKAGSYTIVFAPGEGGSGTMAPLQVETNKTVKLPKCAFVNKNDAVTFSQWKSDAGKTYSDEAEVIGLAKAGETVTLTAQWGCAPFPTLDDGLLDDEKKDVPIGFAAYVYDGYLIATNEDSSIAGVVTVKVDKKGKATATVTRIGVKKLSYKSQMPIANGEVDLVCTKDPAPMHLAVYAGAVEGSCGAYQVRCRKNVAKENPAGYAAVESKVWAVALKADELKAPDTMRGYASLTVTGSKKGKVKISGFLPDGTKVSATVQAAVGADGIVEIPVVAQLYSGKVGGISLALQIDGKTGEAEVRGAGKWKSLAGDLSWDASQSHCTSVNVSGIVRKTDMFVLEEQPEQIGGMNVATQFLHSVSNMAFMGKKWMIAKGGKIKLMGADFVDQAASPNPGGLTLSYTLKTGAFKGKYAIYVNNFGKSKKLSATINGVVVGESGYGTAVIKKTRSIPIQVQNQN